MTKLCFCIKIGSYRESRAVIVTATVVCPCPESLISRYWSEEVDALPLLVLELLVLGGQCFSCSLALQTISA